MDATQAGRTDTEDIPSPATGYFSYAMEQCVIGTKCRNRNPARCRECRQSKTRRQ